MTDNYWKLYKLENPPHDGIYQVRLCKIDGYLETHLEVLMEYWDGTWLMREPLFINDYYVNAWRYVEHQ